MNISLLLIVVFEADEKLSNFNYFETSAGQNSIVIFSLILRNQANSHQPVLKHLTILCVFHLNTAHFCIVSCGRLQLQALSEVSRTGTFSMCLSDSGLAYLWFYTTHWFFSYNFFCTWSKNVWNCNFCWDWLTARPVNHALYSSSTALVQVDEVATDFKQWLFDGERAVCCEMSISLVREVWSSFFWPTKIVLISTLMQINLN